MWEAMRSADIGWPSWGEDPYVNELHEMAAELTGKEAAQLCPTTNVANLLGMMGYCRRGGHRPAAGLHDPSLAGCPRPRRRRLRRRGPVLQLRRGSGPVTARTGRSRGCAESEPQQGAWRTLRLTVVRQRGVHRTGAGEPPHARLTLHSQRGPVRRRRHRRLGNDDTQTGRGSRPTTALRG